MYGVPYNIYIYIMPNLDAGCSSVVLMDIGVLDPAAIFGHFFVVGRKNRIWRKKISGENVSDQCI